jgi:DNA (cytosine-5)-methyltransferase 1
MVVVRELEPLYPDGRPVFIDLFAGCGGFSLGSIQAGMRCIAMVELDYWATVTYTYHIPYFQNAPLHVYRKDIHDIRGQDILRNAGIDEVDVIIGGPPCQSFSRAGRRKVGDPRDDLLWEFGRLIKEIQPKTFVMENVPDIATKRFPNGKLVLKEWGKFMGFPESFGDLPKKSAKGSA